MLLKQGDAIKKETIEEVQQDIVGLRQSVIERVGSFIFKNLILDALTLANRKLSHIKATLLKSHPVAGKKKRKDNHKDSNFEIEESIDLIINCGSLSEPSIAKYFEDFTEKSIFDSIVNLKNKFKKTGLGQIIKMLVLI